MSNRWLLQKKHFAISTGLVFGVGGTSISYYNTKNKYSGQYEGIVLTSGVSTILAYKNLTFGGSLCIDQLTNQHKNLSKLSTELSDLRINRHTSLMDSFSKYLHINQTVEFFKVFGNAEQVYIKKTGITQIELVDKGEMCQLIKKNEKSFVFKRLQDGTFWNIKIETLYHTMTSDKKFEQSLITFTNRIENLDKIFED
ncbi:MAG: hypothetical protein EB079_03200 [Verrucomicrobia bacterium]|nr:hypothetical protein [Verrucomicrobiota bacterium]